MFATASGAASAWPLINTLWPTALARSLDMTTCGMTRTFPRGEDTKSPKHGFAEHADFFPSA